MLSPRSKDSNVSIKSEHSDLESPDINSNTSGGRKVIVTTKMSDKEQNTDRVDVREFATATSKSCDLQEACCCYVLLLLFIWKNDLFIFYIEKRQFLTHSHTFIFNIKMSFSVPTTHFHQNYPSYNFKGVKEKRIWLVTQLYPNALITRLLHILSRWLFVKKKMPFSVSMFTFSFTGAQHISLLSYTCIYMFHDLF